MSAAISLPSWKPLDWWLAVVAAPTERPSGVRLSSSPKLTPEQLAAIKRAARIVASTYRLRADQEDDLRQDVTVRLLEADVSRVRTFESFAVTAATNLVTTQQRDEANRRRLLREAYELGAPRGYETKGGPPKKKRKKDPGPIIVFVRSTVPAAYETALIAAIDDRAEAGVPHAQCRPTSPCEAEHAAEFKRKRAQAQKLIEPAPVRESLSLRD